LKNFIEQVKESESFVNAVSLRVLCLSDSFSFIIADIYIVDDKHTVTVSSSVQIVCVGKGYAANSEVKITKGGQAIATNSGNISTTRTNVTLDSVHCYDAGEYQCTVANSGATSNSIELTVTVNCVNF